MALSYFDLETLPGTTPAPRPQVIASPRPAPADPPDVPPAPPAEAVVDLTDHSASYWVRRRRAEALLRAGQPS